MLPPMVSEQLLGEGSHRVGPHGPGVEGRVQLSDPRAEVAVLEDETTRIALGELHESGLLHRDIAPDNIILLAGSGRPLLLDFGAARRVIGDMTQALTVILKPGYAPVEQYAEIPGMKQGPWTDVYALAAVVYFAIVGRTPPPSVGRLLNDTYKPLVEAAAGRYSPEFLAAVDRALAVRPEQRTQSIAQLREELGLEGLVAPSTVLTVAQTVAQPKPVSAQLPPTAV